MALEDVVNVAITLETVSVSRAGFGVLSIIGTHNQFPERIRSYNSITEVAVDFLTTSDEHKAASAAFAQDPSVSQLKIAKRLATTTLTPDAPSDGDVFNVTVTVNDGDFILATYTAGAAETAENVVDALKIAIDGDAPVAAHVTTAKVGTLAAAVLTIDATVPNTDQFGISALTKITATAATTETAGDGLTQIELVDSDFYFITSTDHTETYALAMAAAGETRDKLYFLSSANSENLGSLVIPAITDDIFGKLQQGNFFRTVGIYHQDADTTFPEMAFVGDAAPFDPGTITWALRQLSGITVSADPTSGNVLTSTQKQNLDDRNANFVTTVGGVPATRTGKAFGGGVGLGEWIDSLRFRDLLVARITENYQTFLLNTTAGKIPFDDNGINQARSVLHTTLDQYVSTAEKPNGLRSTEPYKTTFPRESDVSAADKSARKLNASFTAVLAGAIHLVAITGILSEI